MPTEDQMTVNERRKYLKLMKPRYQKAGRKEQSDLLSEMEQVTGLHRKSLLRLLHAPTLERRKRSKERGRTYGRAVEQVILVVWESLDYVCAERLTPVLLSTAQHLAHCGAVHLTRQVEEQLARDSARPPSPGGCASTAAASNVCLKKGQHAPTRCVSRSR